jgi:hypothetical protein
MLPLPLVSFPFAVKAMFCFLFMSPCDYLHLHRKVLYAILGCLVVTPGTSTGLIFSGQVSGAHDY